MNHIIEFTDILIWPLIALFGMIFFRRTISNAFKSARVKVKIFGVEIETTGEKVADVIWKNFNYFNPSPDQWRLLVQLANSVTPGLKKSSLEQDGFEYKRDFRPLRNSGLIKGDGSTLSNSKYLQITPLGEFIVENSGTKPIGRMEASPIRIDSDSVENDS